MNKWTEKVKTHLKKDQMTKPSALPKNPISDAKSYKYNCSLYNNHSAYI